MPLVALNIERYCNADSARTRRGQMAFIRYERVMREEVISVDILLPFADEELEDHIECVIWEAGVQGFERHDEDTFSHLVDEPFPLPRGAVRWRINIPNETDLDAAIARFRGELEDFPQLEVRAWMRDVTGYRTVWMQFFKPARVSPRIMIHPPWDKPESDAEVMVEIDPGMAFGTGTHETTMLCLALLDRLGVPQGGTVLDVGMGSGILAIAAAKLGAGHCYGVDIDPNATREAARNAEVNGVAEKCTFRTSELTAEDPNAELVIANILPHILIDISDDLIAHMKPGGMLILSGILMMEEYRVTDHFEKAGLKLVTRDELNDWCVLAFEQA